MEITANPTEIEQLVALIEARQFPIGMDFTDPLAKRLYGAMSVLACHAINRTRQVLIARRHINTAMSEMGNNQGGYYHLKRCLEEMNAQTQEAEGKKAAVVLCQQYQEQWHDLIPEAKAAVANLKEAADVFESALPSVISHPELEMHASEVKVFGNEFLLQLRGIADLITKLVDFNVPTVVAGGDL